MTEPAATRPASPPSSSAERGGTAGALLRQARQAQGLHVAQVAAAIKVVPKKLEALEADRIDQLPDATFARALAQAVCRHLKTDPAPVLALLPPLSGPRRLEEVAEGLNTPFRETAGRLAPREWARGTMPALGFAVLIGIATLAIYLFPHWRSLLSASASRTPVDAASGVPGASAASAAIVGVPLAAGTADTMEPPAAGPATVGAAPDAVATERSAVAGSPAASAAAAPAQPAASAPGGWLQVRATAASWIGVTDARGKVLISRTLQADEQVALEGEPPLRIRIGNAQATRMTVRGQPFDLAAYTRDNIVRFDLK